MAPKRKALDERAVGSTKKAKASTVTHSCSQDEGGDSGDDCDTNDGGLLRCPKCGDDYSSEKSHKQLCGRREIICFYPSGPSSNELEKFTITRGGDLRFACLRCSFQRRKPQDLQKHSKTCMGTNAASTSRAASSGRPSREIPSSPHLTSSTPTGDQLPTWSSTKEPSSSLRPGLPNNSEVLVTPGQDSILDDPLLLPTTFIVNTTFNILICISCGHAVNPRKAAGHTTKYHPACKLSPGFTTKLLAKYPHLVSEASSVAIDWPIPPVFGLAIPDTMYQICHTCNRGYKNTHTANNHGCKVPTTDRSYSASLVQTLFRGPKCSYFAIVTPEFPPAQPPDAFSIFKSQLDSSEATGERVSVAEDYRQLNQFLVKEGWIKHVENLSISELSSISMPPAEDPLTKVLRCTTYQLLARIQRNVDKAGFHRNYDMALTHDQTQACKELQHATQAATDASLIPCIHQPSPRNDFAKELGGEDDFYHEDYDSLCDDLKDPDDEVFDDNEAIYGEHDPGELDDGNAPVVHPAVASDGREPNLDLQSKILALLVSLYAHLPQGNDDKFYSPIVRFIILRSLKAGGLWLPARRITQLIVMTLFTGRLVMMALMEQFMEKNQGVRFGRAFLEISRYLREEHEGPMPTLYLLLRPLNRLVSAEQGTLQFNGTHPSGTDIMLDDKIITVADLGSTVRTMTNEIRRMLQDEIFFGLDIVDLERVWGIIRDDPRNVLPGYAWFKDLANNLGPCEHVLARAMLTHPRLRGLFHFIDTNGGIVWKAGACLPWVDTCHEVEMHLSVVTQLSAGEPGRGTELASHLIRNISGGSIRNVFVIFQYFCLMGTYNKTSHLSDQDLTMIRVPCPEVGRLWMLLIVFVRPMVIILQQYFRGAKAAARARSHLFFGSRPAVTSSDLSRTLSFHTHRLLGVKIPISLLRHIITWFMNCHSVRVAEQSTFSNRAALAAQMGHSVSTHALYAGDSQLPQGIDYHTFFVTMRTSGEWHQLIGARESKLLADMGRGHASMKTTRQPEANQPPFPGYTMSDLVDELRRRMVPQLVNIYSQTRANDLAMFLEAAGLEMPTPTSTEASSLVSCQVHPSRLRDLRHFLEDDSATFSDAQQALAVEFVAAQRPSLFLFNPTITETTGAGRMLPIFMGAMLYHQSATTVLVLPFVDMIPEYLLFARGYGLKCESWPLADIEGDRPSILLAAAESFASPAFIHFFERMCGRSQIVRLAVEEAHMLHRLATLRPLVDTLWRFSLPILLTSSVCPRGLERLLFDAIGRKAYEALRCRADGLKIKLRTVAIGANDFTRKAIAHVRSEIPKNQGRHRVLVYCQAHSESCVEDLNHVDDLGVAPLYDMLTSEGLCLRNSEWRQFARQLRLLPGCCCFCGISTTMVCCHLNGDGYPQSLVHTHPADDKCPWIQIVKPLAYFAQFNSTFWKSLCETYLLPSQASYVAWLANADCDGVQNLVNVLLLATEHLGLSQLDP
ncbi:hypothetical protein BDN71DRAFT_1434142 [Pleurotus eryngii]|uniref:Uncharacterized protein n=1 Tax=Pleurotus eryngii TaxID=5323 RepID=A0A9P5ZPH5_PLEER|nr:hypothetical protein BDN71DRAFT_1434142 [Pleurotus eryngii]